MLKQLNKYFGVMVSIIFLFSNCEFQPPANGNYNDIMVIADDDDWNRSADELKMVYEREIKTPQTERLFTVKRPPLEYLDINKKHRNLIIMGTLETGGEVGRLLNNMINEDVRNAILGGEYVYVKKDEFAREQTLIVIIAPDIEKLKTQLLVQEDRLFNIVNNSVNRNLELGMFSREEQTDISDKIFEDHGFSMRVQHDYFVARDSKEDKVVWLRRVGPGRMIFVHWIDTTGVGTISEEWVKNKRNELGRKFMDNTKINEPFTKYKKTDFLGYLATEIRGLWWHEEKFVGGPLINYTFYDDETSRIYMIDLMVQAPEEFNAKEPYIRQLEIIARTFTTANYGN